MRWNARMGRMIAPNRDRVMSGTFRFLCRYSISTRPYDYPISIDRIRNRLIDRPTGVPLLPHASLSSPFLATCNVAASTSRHPTEGQEKESPVTPTKRERWIAMRSPLNEIGRAGRLAWFLSASKEGFLVFPELLLPVARGLGPSCRSAVW